MCYPKEERNLRFPNCAVIILFAHEYGNVIDERRERNSMYTSKYSLIYRLKKGWMSLD